MSPLHLLPSVLLLFFVLSFYLSRPLCDGFSGSRSVPLAPRSFDVFVCMCVSGSDGVLEIVDGNVAVSK